MQVSDCLHIGIPDELILGALSFVEAKDLINFQATCKRYRNLETEDLWRALCAHRWQGWPIYSSDDRLRHNPNEEREESPASTWKGRYEWVERDFRRTEITQDDLESLEWHFNFLPWAGGSSNGTGTRSLAYFHQGRLFILKYLWMYPSLNYEVITRNTEIDSREDANLRGGLEEVILEPLRLAVISAGTSSPRYSDIQYIQISSFPPHFVARTSVGGWILWNENVVFFSAGLPRGEQMPDQLEMHIDMFRFG